MDDKEIAIVVMRTRDMMCGIGVLPKTLSVVFFIPTLTDVQRHGDSWAESDEKRK